MSSSGSSGNATRTRPFGVTATRSRPTGESTDVYATSIRPVTLRAVLERGRGLGGGVRDGARGDPELGHTNASFRVRSLRRPS